MTSPKSDAQIIKELKDATIGKACDAVQNIIDQKAIEEAADRDERIFQEGVSWRDRNPSPEVLRMAKAIEAYEDADVINRENDFYLNIEMFDALEAFEKAGGN